MVGFRRKWLPWGAVFAGVAALTLGGLGSYPLTDRDEGEYAGAVASMQRHDDWAIPTLNGQPYLEKPILVFWLVGGAWRLFGRDEFSTRLPSALAALAVLASLGWLVTRATRRRHLALLAVLCLGAMPLFQAVAHLCMTDLIVAWSVTWSLLCFFVGMERMEPDGSEGAPGLGWFVAAWAGLGIGFLAKGPVAPAIALPTALLYSVMQRRLRAALAPGCLIAGIATFAAIAAPWYFAAYERLGHEFIEGFFGAQILARGTRVLLGHGGGLGSYLPVVLLGACPITAAALPGWWMAFAGNPPARRRLSAERRLALLSGLTVVVTLALFTVAATKLPHYVLPAFPFLAILAAGFLLHLRRVARRRPWLLRSALGLLVLTLGTLTVLSAMLPLMLVRFWPRLAGMIRPDSSEYALPTSPPSCGGPAVILAVVTAVTLVVGWLLLRRRRGFPAGVALAIGGGLQFVALLLLVIRLLGAVQVPAVRLARELRPVLSGKDVAVTYGLWKPTLFYYLDRDLPRYLAERDADGAALDRRLESHTPVFVFTRRSLLDRLGRLQGFHELATDGGYAIGGNPAARAAWRRFAGGGDEGSGTRDN